MKHLPVSFVAEIDGESFMEAERPKSAHKISLADAVLLTEAAIRGVFVVTSDHHELDVVEAVERKIRFF
jgi:hypothetical protein